MNTGTMKYKSTGKYEFGWSDPRAVRKAASFKDLVYPLDMHFCVEMTDDQLKAAWLLHYGDRPITFIEISRRSDSIEGGVDELRIALEAHSRGLLISQHDFSSFSEIYVLKDKLNASS